MDTEVLGEITRSTLRIDSDLFWSLKELAVHERTNVTNLVNEAITDLLAKYGSKKK